MTVQFKLDPTLEQDTVFVQSLSLSDMLLMNDSRFPWVILVPRKMSVSEIHELNAEEQVQLLSEISNTSKMMKRQFKAHKMNIAALGNKVAQLHIHIIARFNTDSAWPNPVWGVGSADPYSQQALADILMRLYKKQYYNPLFLGSGQNCNS